MVSGLLSEVRLITGAYEELMSEKLDDLDTTTTLEAEDESDEEVDKSGAKEIGRRIRIASSKYYDIILYMLPKGARYQHKWPEGSWTIIQPLTGLIEIAQLRLDRDGFYTKMRPRDFFANRWPTMIGSLALAFCMVHMLHGKPCPDGPGSPTSTTLPVTYEPMLVYGKSYEHQITA